MWREEERKEAEGGLHRSPAAGKMTRIFPNIFPPRNQARWEVGGEGSFSSVSESVEYCVLLSSVKSMKTTHVKVKCGKAGLYGGITVQ